MKLTTVLFDLDGTLLPMDNDAFTKGYFKLLASKLLPYGYDSMQLVDSIWKGTAAMVKNDGRRSNEDIFWTKFSELDGERALADKPIFEDFYNNEFMNAKTLCGYNLAAAEAVRNIKEKGLRVALATNPVFPAAATEMRIRWAGFEPTDFELYTSYENTCFCKPNPNYYRDVAHRLGVRTEECLMVGNDVADDMIAESVGMKVFLLTDCLINREGKNINAYPNGNFLNLIDFIADLIG